MPLGWIYDIVASTCPAMVHMGVRHTVDPGYNCEIVQCLKSEDVAQLVGRLPGTYEFRPLLSQQRNPLW